MTKFIRSAIIYFLLAIAVCGSILLSKPQLIMSASASLLTDPFLQLPTEDSIRVVWFTDFEGTNHRVLYGEKLEKSIEATTTKLSRIREDEKSKITPPYQQTTPREIWRHEAKITGLTPGKRIPYQVSSDRDRQEIKSKRFSLTPQPQAGTPLKILLTSDHQLMPMTAANLQKVTETIAQVDAVFLAGDLVNIPDRASEWFDDLRGGAFFPCLQGRANYTLEKDGIATVYRGGELIQSAPLFTAIGNHEVMGRFSTQKGLNEQFEDAFPRQQATKYEGESDRDRLKDRSYNVDTYEEIFSLPADSPGGEKYYAVTFGDIRLVVLYVTNIWRSPSFDPQVKGRYQEAVQDLDNPENWGYGQHIFEAIAKGSEQHTWLEKELQSQAFQQAKYKIVMFHHPVHTLGGNIVPPYTDPIPQIDYDADGKIQAVRYEYPREKDYIIRDLMPLLESAGVQFVFYGHSHLWNRFVSPTGIHFLESSNVGNSYGAYIGEKKRPIPSEDPQSNYIASGDSNGLEPVMPTLDPLKDESDRPIPYIASNDITAFSILDTSNGTVSSYRFDTRKPDSEVVKFDEFRLIQRETKSDSNDSY